MMLSLPQPDLIELFKIRLQKLIDVLYSKLIDDLDLILVIPECPDPEEQRYWNHKFIENNARMKYQSLSCYRANATNGVPSPPWTVRTTLSIVRNGRDKIAEMLASEVLFCVENFVCKKMRTAVLSRPEIVERWPRPSTTIDASTLALDALTTAVSTLPKHEPPPNHLLDYAGGEFAKIYQYWPGEAAPALVEEWAQKGFNIINEKLEKNIQFNSATTSSEKKYRVPAAGLAILYLAELNVRAGSLKPAMAIDASKEHHDLVGGMRDWPKDGKRHSGGSLTQAPIRSEDIIERVELLTPGSTVQLHLPMTEFQSMQDHAIEALRRLRGAKGLRHWAALLRLFSVQGGRSGTYRWLLSEHLEAMGYDERQRRDPKVRAEAAHEVETLAALELAIYTKGGQLRERRRLLLETGRFERQSGAEYKLDGIEFQMNQRVFGGVRASTGEIGAKWMPAPVELAAVDHVRFPYAHALGMLLTIRIRWRLDEHANHLSLSGEHLLRLAGINFDQERAERTWDKLRRSLDVLVKIEQLERYEWNSDPWSLAGICQIYPSAWLLDRAARGVIPEERPPDRDRPLTGGELKRWRERHGMSQQAAAQRLHVTRQAITKAEQQSNVTLGYKLRAAFETTSRTQDTVPEKSNSPADSEK